MRFVIVGIPNKITVVARQNLGSQLVARWYHLVSIRTANNINKKKLRRSWLMAER